MDLCPFLGNNLNPFQQASHAAQRASKSKLEKNVGIFIIPSQYIRILLFLPTQTKSQSDQKIKSVAHLLASSPFFVSKNQTMNCLLLPRPLFLLLHCAAATAAAAAATAADAAVAPTVLLCCSFRCAVISILFFSFRLKFGRGERNYTTQKRSWHNSKGHASYEC